MSDIRKQLADLGSRRQAARAEVQETSARIADLAPKAIEAGLTKIEVATLAQISRPALDDMLARHDGGS